MNLTDTGRAQLLSAAHSRTVRAADVRRAKLILMLEDGESRVGIMSALRCARDSSHVGRGVSSMSDCRARTLATPRAFVQPPAKLEARVLYRTLKHTNQPTVRHHKLAAELGDVSVSAAQRIWRKHGIKQQRLGRHMVSNDPDFETKAADMMGFI